jgi:hypothetical protein
MDNQQKLYKPTARDLELIISLINVAIEHENKESGLGDQPRRVGLRLRSFPPIEPFIPYLISEKIHIACMFAITDLWDDSREESMDYYLEIYGEFKYGLTFLDEAISYT